MLRYRNRAERINEDTSDELKTSSSPRLLSLGSRNSKSL